MGGSENCLSDAASRPANSAAQGAPTIAGTQSQGVAAAHLGPLWFSFGRSLYPSSRVA